MVDKRGVSRIMSKAIQDRVEQEANQRRALPMIMREKASWDLKFGICDSACLINMSRICGEVPRPPYVVEDLNLVLDQLGTQSCLVDF